MESMQRWRKEIKDFGTFSFFVNTNHKHVVNFKDYVSELHVNVLCFSFGLPKQQVKQYPAGVPR